jgi:hypothetical protein
LSLSLALVLVLALVLALPAKPRSRDSKDYIRAGLPRDLHIEIVDHITKSI